MPTHTISQVYQTPGDTLSLVTTYSDDTELNIDLTLGASANNTWTGGITVANLKSLAIQVSTGAVTIRATNSGGTILFGGAQLAAGAVAIYGSQALAAAALGGSNITALYFLADTAGSSVKIRRILSKAP